MPLRLARQNPPKLLLQENFEYYEEQYISIAPSFATTTTASPAGIHYSESLSPRAAERTELTTFSHDLEPGLGPEVSHYSSQQQTSLPTGLRCPEPSYAGPSSRTTALPLYREQHRSSHRRSLLNTLFPISKSLQRQRDQPSSRLWNPINYVPRTAVVPLPRTPPASDTAPHPESGRPERSREAYPLLTLPEQRRGRGTSPSSLVVERSVDETGSGRTSIGLPPSQRRSQSVGHLSEAGEMGVQKEPADPPTELSEKDSSSPPITAPEQAHLPGLKPSTPPAEYSPTKSEQLPPQPQTIDPELGYKYAPDNTLHAPRHTISHASLRTHTFASTTASGGPEQGAPPDPSADFAWGPSHPCFPHLNPHVPITSPDYASTRIIRIRRDWMVAGDLAPTFSNLYPEILDPLLPESEFRTVIKRVNESLVLAFKPWGWRNWLDACLGVLTGWMWEDIGLTNVKVSLKEIEKWIERWNRDVGVKEGVRIWGLRRTGYLSLDIQIPDPHVGIVSSEANSRPGTRPSTAAGL